MWIARGKNGILILCEYKPFRTEADGFKEYVTWTDICDTGIEIQINSIIDKQFPNLKWEDEPVEVELTAKQTKSNYVGNKK